MGAAAPGSGSPSSSMCSSATGAQLYIESTLGKGSLFRCDFPPDMIVTEERAADLSHSA